MKFVRLANGGDQPFVSPLAEGRELKYQPISGDLLRFVAPRGGA